jgi:hypothetical protein
MTPSEVDDGHSVMTRPVLSKDPGALSLLLRSFHSERFFPLECFLHSSTQKPADQSLVGLFRILLYCSRQATVAYLYCAIAHKALLLDHPTRGLDPGLDPGARDDVFNADPAIGDGCFFRPSAELRTTGVSRSVAQRRRPPIAASAGLLAASRLSDLASLVYLGREAKPVETLNFSRLVIAGCRKPSLISATKLSPNSISTSQSHGSINGQLLRLLGRRDDILQTRSQRQEAPRGGAMEEPALSTGAGRAQRYRSLVFTLK